MRPLDAFAWASVLAGDQVAKRSSVVPSVRRARHEPSSRITWRSKAPVPLDEKASQRAPGVVMAQGGRTMTSSSAVSVAPPEGSR